MVKNTQVIALLASLLLASGCTSDEPDTVVPADVTDLAASDAAAAILLTWTDNTVDEDVIGYEVSWRPQQPQGGPTTKAKTLLVPRGQGSKGLNIAEVEEGVEYLLAVRTLDAAGNKSPGAELTWVTYEDPDPEVFLSSFGFSAALNPRLPEPLRAARRLSERDLLIEYLVPSVVDGLETLVPVFSANGKVYAEGVELVSGVTPLDFSRTVALVVRKPNGREQTYHVSINTPQTTGLPVVSIETRDGVAVESKDEYVEATFSIVSQKRVVHKGTTRIKGRGNATWSYPKKPYRLKLEVAQNLLSIMKSGAAKSWVLLANYCDKTLLRNTAALWLGDRMGFDWTPRSAHVELLLNGEYLGNYELTEYVEQSPNRVDVPEETGYLFERDNYWWAEPVYFSTTKKEEYFSFKHPDPDDITGEQVNALKNFMDTLETSLYSEGFGDAATGYRRYIDAQSFARWLLFQELIANLDTNPYIHIDDLATGKLKMGPLWDFEWSMGIGWYDGPRPRPADYFTWRDGFYFPRLLEDPAFVAELKDVWSRHKDALRSELFAFIDAQAAINGRSQELNFLRWPILFEKVSVGGVPMGSYWAEVQCDKEFLSNRLDWVDRWVISL